ncbi:hypothetical protein MMC18_002026 [Xylographa bjoerkii]|nr:hypothetical protein [Xylographa bjoerkii]
MPCFKGLAVSIHTPDGPLSEYSIQKQTRASRITSYIPVPPPKVTTSSATAKPEQSTFAISITLLTPGLNVPYSTPKPSADDPYPRPQLVSGLPGITSDRGRYGSAIGPYVPLTTSPNETIAAYIYFDGRQKEEVATLLRRGEETWVNSRWVSVPDSEGGGLAEREFLFREVGLERWLNGLDLEGKDVAAKIERRRQKMEKKRKKRAEFKGSDDEEVVTQWGRTDRFDKGVLRYGADERSPLEKLSDEDDLFSSDDESDDDPVPEATGQIKVALFRVLASGEIKKGEYSPQFDAHDDDEDTGKSAENGNGTNGEGSEEADIDHTTSFAKPKTLDPKSISTQTVTGIDGPEKPYAVFTFLYRGEKQLQKMGILKSSKPEKPTSSTAKRRSVQTDFANLKPLKPGGALGFTTFRDASDPRDKSASNKSMKDDEMESDEDEEVKVEAFIKSEEVEGDDFRNSLLSPEDAKRQGELSEGVKKIKLKRQHSFEPPHNSPSQPPATRGKSISNSTTPTSASSPPTLLTSAVYEPATSTPQDSQDPWSATPKFTDAWGEAEKGIWGFGEKKLEDETIIGSPMKKQRASMSGLESEFRKNDAGRVLGSSGVGLGMGFSGVGADGGFGNEFGGELRRASEALPAVRSGGIAESASMPVLGENSVGPSGGSVTEPSIHGSIAPGEDMVALKSEAMEDEEL